MSSWVAPLVGVLLPLAIGVVLQLFGTPALTASLLKPLIVMYILMIVLGMLQSIMMIPMAMMRWY